jgi:hypothetical protein
VPAGSALLRDMTVLRLLHLAVAIPVLFAAIGTAEAQSSACAKLIADLDAVERASAAMPGRLAQYEDAIDRQRFELTRTSDYAFAIGCGAEGEGTQQCRGLQANISRMERNLQRLENDAAQIANEGRGNAERTRLVTALRQQGCAGFANGEAGTPSLFNGLFGTLPEEPVIDPALTAPEAGVGYDDQGAEQPVRTICVRKCDGFYFPISFEASSPSFVSQQRICAAMCPATEVELFAYSPISQQPDEAISTETGQLLRAMPNAFRFRKVYDPACQCKRPGESWAQALSGAEELLTAGKGDIVVTEESSRAMQQPKGAEKGTDNSADKAPAKPKKKAPVADPAADPDGALLLDGPTTVDPQ